MSCGHSDYMLDYIQRNKTKQRNEEIEKSWLIEDEYGFYQWDCPHCHYKMVTMSKQHVASARSNHLRKHSIDSDKQRKQP